MKQSPRYEDAFPLFSHLKISRVTNLLESRTRIRIYPSANLFESESDRIRIRTDRNFIEPEPERIRISTNPNIRIWYMPIHELLSGCIYIFCGRIIKHAWAYDYAENLLMFDHETDLFARLLRDIAKYYTLKSENSSDRTRSIEYLRWARRLAQRANKLDDDDIKFIKDIEKRLATLEPPESTDEQVGQAVDDG